MKYPLFTHQRDAVQFAIANDGKCAIFHCPGLGKTRTCLEIYKFYKADNPGLKLLVVCPLSLVNSAWGEEIKKFTNFTYAYFKEIKNDLPDILIINYEALISHRNLPEIHRLIRSYNFMCIIDESARLKNNKSLTTKTLLSLSEYFQYRLIASGMPMPNSELELWGQINFVRPSILHKSFYAFRNMYFHLERDGEAMLLRGHYISRTIMRDILSRGWKYNITLQNRQKIMDIIKPFSHWVKKEDALDLPEKIDEVREVVLNAKERKAYNEMKHDLITEIKGKEITAQVTLAKLMKLRQSTSGFFYDENGKAMEVGNSSKLKELEDILEELGPQQVIVWIEFHHEVKIIQKLISKKYGSEQIVTLYADTTDKDDAISRFKNNQARYLIAHPRSGGHGLTFTNCNTMIFFSLDYSYEAHSQARDRVHRIGQKNSCLYIYIIAKDSIDEELLKVLQKKQNLQEAVYAIVRNKT